MTCPPSRDSHSIGQEELQMAEEDEIFDSLFQ